MTRSISSKIAIVSFLIASLFLSGSLAQAATGLSIQPVKVNETMLAGKVITGSILLTNVSDDDVDVQVSMQDFIPVAGAESIQFVGRAPGVTTVKDWIKIGDKDSFVFKKGESRSIPYTITAPADAEPGGHFGVVFFKATRPGPTDQLKVGTQVGMLVLVTIPGNHLEKGNILDFTTKEFIQNGPVFFSLKFENTGTVHFEPKGHITVTSMFGEKVAEVPIGGQVILPTSIKTLHAVWEVAGVLLGRYNAVATIFDGEGNELTSQSASFWVFPVWYILGFLSTLVLAFFVIRFIRRRFSFSISLK